MMLGQNSNTSFAQESITPLVKVNAIYFKAQRFYERKNWRAAKEAYQDFLAISDRNVLFIPAMYYLAYCYQQLHENQKSATLYHKVITQANEDEAFWSQMAQKRLEEVSPTISSLN